ncbi:hypothetical protein DFH07DRAFT_1017828 [Mycena maculata]|uniref:Peptidase M28 domain-containing protein n=1 Tax=Mycena maculata TaxID=230809 RepID=A0AAD7KCY2_9AGAR|nr:hypothetical protein DFH07DRAFT_1017828 [Mycena maculata]
MVRVGVLVYLVAARSAFAAASPSRSPCLDQPAEQVLYDRLFQTNLRGPRWTGNENQNTLTDLVAASMEIAGLTVETLNYTLYRWDPRWWSLSLKLTNGTTLGLPTTGYWPYSGDSGLQGVTAAMYDGGSYGLFTNETANLGTLNFTGLPGPSSPSVFFFDNPSPTHNYSQPGYGLVGTSVPAEDIPELGNLTNPHWQSAKGLNFTAIQALGVSAIVASWVNTSDADASMQFLPEQGAGNGSLFDVPALYVGNSTGETIRELLATGQVVTATVVLDAPSIWSPSNTVIGHLDGQSGTNDTIIIYTHSDGPSIIEENGPILLLAIAEYFSAHPLNISLDFVITTGHMSGHNLNESAWMGDRPDILANGKAAIVCEHFGALEWKDNFTTGEPVYEATGKYEPMWTMVNSSSASDMLHELYIDAFEGTPETLRMAMVSPQAVDIDNVTSTSMWYGVGGSSTLGYSNIPTVGIIPQPDYLWASLSDGGWSKLDVDMAITQINVILRLVTALDEKYIAGEL